MIVYDLECLAQGHRFEGWFKSSNDFASQQKRGLLCCPFCGSADVDKALQAPRLARKGNQRSEYPIASPDLKRSDRVPDEARSETVPVAHVASQELPLQAMELIHKLVEVQASALKSSRYVGDDFAECARSMHYGEREVEAIHGETSLNDAQDLLEEGISVIPLPFPLPRLRKQIDCWWDQGGC